MLISPKWIIGVVVVTCAWSCYRIVRITKLLCEFVPENQEISTLSKTRENDHEVLTISQDIWITGLVFNSMSIIASFIMLFASSNNSDLNAQRRYALLPFLVIQFIEIGFTIGQLITKSIRNLEETWTEITVGTTVGILLLIASYVMVCVYFHCLQKHCVDEGKLCDLSRSVKEPDNDPKIYTSFHDLI